MSCFRPRHEDGVLNGHGHVHQEGLVDVGLHEVPAGKGTLERDEGGLVGSMERLRGPCPLFPEGRQ